jgi:hypothetical protein
VHKGFARRTRRKICSQRPGRKEVRQEVQPLRGWVVWLVGFPPVLPEAIRIYPLRGNAVMAWDGRVRERIGQRMIGTLGTIELWLTLLRLADELEDESMEVLEF